MFKYWELLATAVWVGAGIWLVVATIRMSQRAAAKRGASLWVDAWKRLAKNRAALVSLGVIFFIGIACLLGPWLLRNAGITYHAGDYSLGAQPPRQGHWFGTDKAGRDMLARVLLGLRISLAVAIIAGAVASIVGTLYGAVAGYRGGKTDDVMMRTLELIYALPFTLIVIVLGAVLAAQMELISKKFIESSGGADAMEQIAAHSIPILIILFFAIGLVAWPTLALIVRGQVRSLKQQEFVLAARAIGTPTWRIIWWHLVPNVLGFVAVYATIEMPTMMLYEAVLSFIGLGVQAPFPSLGALIDTGSKDFNVHWWVLVFPASAMCSTLLAFNFLGDGLRDALDPKQKGVS